MGRTRYLTFCIPILLTSCLQIYSGCTENTARAQVTNPALSGWPVDSFKGSTVNLDEFRCGGLGKDGIPSLSSPAFVKIGSVPSELDDQEPVIVYRNGNAIRGYPLSVLLWHEIVNDTVNGQPIAVTYCPLCNAAIVFDRSINDRVLDFGVTGFLRNSDMVMYDRQTLSWWQQFTGECLSGRLSGQKLRILPAQILSYADLSKVNPDARILSVQTGYQRAYGTSPYPGYDKAKGPFHYDRPIDPKLPAMTRIIGLIVNKQSRAYPNIVVERKGVINDIIAGRPIVILAAGRCLSVLDQQQISKSASTPSPVAFSARVGSRSLTFGFQRGTLTDDQTHSAWNLTGECKAGPLKGSSLTTIPAIHAFAFAWFAFYPQSTIYLMSHNQGGS